MNVRRLVAGSVAAAALSFAAVPAVAPASPTTPVVTCTSATIGGQSKCIARGQYCARAHARDYRRYGLACTNRDARGRYHLR